MAPAFAIPRLLAWQGLTYADMDIWEIHEAFAAEVGGTRPAGERTMASICADGGQGTIVLLQAA
jgi:acetyl-CoA acetyltransferase